MHEDRFGFELPLLLAGAFRSAIDQLHSELATQGHDRARPLHGFALQAMGPEGVTISELGRRLGVSKQAAAKTATGLERLGYAERSPDPRDSRAIRLHRTGRGEELLALSAAIFQRQRDRLVGDLGSDRVRALEDDLIALAAVAGRATIGDFPGWLD